MSPRAAWRLESLGFTEVYDYVAGEADWLANGLPSEGGQAGRLRAGDLARPTVPTCGLSERVGDVRRRLWGMDWDGCVVTNDEGVVLGRLHGTAWDGLPDAAVGEVMESGPTTIRPSELLAGITARMRERHVSDILVTGSDGRLIGVLSRADAERLLRPEG